MQEEKKTTSEVIPALLFVTICYSVAFIGFLGVSRGIPGWYDTLLKPAWTPPNWLFSPVWTILYGLTAWAGWSAWKSTSSGRSAALTAFGLQLTFNALWCWLFFGFQKPKLALIEIAILLLLEIATCVLFLRMTRIGLALLPLIAWTGFAALLNYSILELNR